METGVVVFSYSRLDVEAVRKAIKMSPTSLADAHGIKPSSILQIPNALHTLAGNDSPVRSIEEGREAHHMHVSLLCILPEANLRQVLMQADGLSILPLGYSEPQHIFLLSGTAFCWRQAIDSWRVKPTKTLEDFTSKAVLALGSIGMKWGSNGLLSRQQGNPR